MKSHSLRGVQKTGFLKKKTLLPSLLGLLLFCSLGAGSEWFFFEFRQGEVTARKTATVSRTDTLRAVLEGELNAVYYLSYGVADHWAFNNDPSASDKTRKFFADIFRQSRHVRRFVISVGTQLAYAYPPSYEGDHTLESELDRQTPWLLQSYEAGPPLLEWANQPERGLAYRVPIVEDGQLLGLLTTVIDDSSLFSVAGLTQTSEQYEYAVRALGTNGEDRGIILGSALLFGKPGTLVSNIPIPGGNWQLGVKPITAPSAEIWLWLFRILGWLSAATISGLALALRELNCKLAEQALYDPLTGLPSQHLLLDRLKQLIRRTKRTQGSFSILCIKLNEFKSVNESQGAKVGDMLLTGIGKRLMGFVRNCDTVTRWEGEKFLILLDGCPQDQATLIAENLRHQIELPVYCGVQKLLTHASIGLATYPIDGHSLTALLKVAEVRKVRDGG